MATMQAKGIEKSFGDRQILRGCDLSVEPGECVGLVGINGAGKSTLLRIISGELEPDFGTVIGPGGDGAPGAGLGYLSQDPDLPGQNVGEALDAAIDWHRDLLNRYEQAMSDGRDRIAADLQEEIEQHGWQMDHQVAAMAERLGVAPRERAISALSGGERRRLALARVLLAAPKLLILDEPTNHLDAETIEWLQDWLERFRGAVLLVTHDRYLLEATANQLSRSMMESLCPTREAMAITCWPVRNVRHCSSAPKIGDWRCWPKRPHGPPARRPPARRNKKRV